MAPARVLLNCSIADSLAFTFLLSGGLMSVVYYLTIRFQAAKDDSAMHAGISTIPWVSSLVIMSVAAAIFTKKIEYYVPAMLIASESLILLNETDICNLKPSTELPAHHFPDTPHVDHRQVLPPHFPYLS